MALSGSNNRMVSVYFSPDRGVASEVVSFIERCDSSLDIAIYAITHERIADAVIRAQKRGLEIRIIMDRLQATSVYSNNEYLVGAGLQVRYPRRPGTMHHKFMIGDGAVVCTGSFNWTKNADRRNAENLVVIRLGYVVERFQQEFDTVWETNSP